AGTVVVIRDGRRSGLLLGHAGLAGVLAGGSEVIDLGVAPTPTCGLAVRRLQGAGGIQITASHNPAAWNGLKLFAAGGMVLSAEEGGRIRDLFEAKAFRRVPGSKIGTVMACDQAEAWHRDCVRVRVDAARIRALRPRVFLDANGGAGGPLGGSLLEALGCQVVCQACSANGVFEHEPEPVLANLQEICPRVAQHGAD